MFGAKLSWCQIVRCQIVLVPNCPGAKLSTFIILVPNCLLLLSWCQIVRFIILVPNCPVPNCPVPNCPVPNCPTICSSGGTQCTPGTETTSSKCLWGQAALLLDSTTAATTGRVSRSVLAAQTGTWTWALRTTSRTLMRRSSPTAALAAIKFTIIQIFSPQWTEKMTRMTFVVILIIRIFTQLKWKAE